MTSILTHRLSDQLPSYETIGVTLRRLYGERGRCEIVAEKTPFGPIFMAFVVATVASGPIVIDHPIDDGKAQLEWWQQDHVLCGFGRSRNEGEAIDQALAAARRGQLERLEITLWLDRVRARYQAFRRSPRGDAYRPTGAPITREAFAALVS